MDYKLLRALSIALQTGLVILLLLLLSLFLFSFKPLTVPTAKIKVQTEVKKDVMEQRFFNEIQKQRLSIKTLCLEKQVKQLPTLPKTPLATSTYGYTSRKA